MTVFRSAVLSISTGSVRSAHSRLYLAEVQLKSIDETRNSSDLKATTASGATLAGVTDICADM
jgi:hypothetical protein